MTDDFDALARTLDARWTCRQFLPDQVPPATIERLLAVAQRTPSWCEHAAVADRRHRRRVN